MKYDRSNVYTTGLCNTFSNIDLRTFFFEIDNVEHYSTIKDLLVSEQIDFLVHKTGNGGYHFISPTMLIKEYWKKLMYEIDYINPKCPMTTLRMEPNKYPNENNIWYNYEFKTFYNTDINSYDMCIYINHIWHSNFSGSGRQQLKIVRYPLPYPQPTIEAFNDL